MSNKFWAEQVIKTIYMTVVMTCIILISSKIGLIVGSINVMKIVQLSLLFSLLVRAVSYIMDGIIEQPLFDSDISLDDMTEENKEEKATEMAEDMVYNDSNRTKKVIGAILLKAVVLLILEVGSIYFITTRAGLIVETATMLLLGLLNLVVMFGLGKYTKNIVDKVL